MQVMSRNWTSICRELASEAGVRVPAGIDCRRELKMCVNYEDYMKKRNVLHLILLHTITYGLATALAWKTRL